MINITNLTKKDIPKISFQKIKEEILGESYKLDLIFADDKKMKALNKTYRKKDKIANTLAFSYSKKQGEIFLNINNTEKEAFFLFIHSLLHLQGFKHGDEMEKEEKKYLKNFPK